MVRILLADDHEVVRVGLRSLLEERTGWQVIAEAANGQDAVHKAIELKPDVAIVDHALPLLSGVDATRAICADVPGVAVLFFTIHDDDHLLCDAFAAGARGYLLKSDAQQDVCTAVEALAAQRVTDQRDRRFVADRAMWANLVIVSTPSLAFLLRIVQAHEPVRRQALSPQLAVEGLDERVVRRLAGPREVERDSARVRPQVEIARYELRPERAVTRI